MADDGEVGGEAEAGGKGDERAKSAGVARGQRRRRTAVGATVGAAVGAAVGGGVDAEQSRQEDDPDREAGEDEGADRVGRQRVAAAAAHAQQ